MNRLKSRKTAKRIKRFGWTGNIQAQQWACLHWGSKGYFYLTTVRKTRSGQVNRTRQRLYGSEAITAFDREMTSIRAWFGKTLPSI